MHNRKWVVALVLLFAVPGAASALKTENVTVVEGHTVYAAIEKEDRIEFAAIAGIARETLVIRGVFWFNDQELFPTQTIIVNNVGFVIAVEAGDDNPEASFGVAEYVESYSFVDPNNQAWIVDFYTYEKCVTTGPPLPPLQTTTCEDEPMFVVATGATTVDAAPCNPASPGGAGCPTNKEYNFVNLVRLDALDALCSDCKAHPSATDDTLAGDSHDTQGAPAAAHTHDTAQVDLYFLATRPAEPGARTFRFVDAVGSAAPYDAHP
ncbi:MAG TPA: hypothetical protein VM681_07065 [Candidatus Thermoplasmatota archaeon]|nr:hypothetical protein [Candidatus Thermoplasmatota archaeon]